MKIAHTESSNGWGGQEIRILDESLGMIERGHEVCVICTPNARIFDEAIRRGVKVTALPIGKKRLHGIFAMRNWLKANPVDVINTHSSTDTWLTVLACKILRNPPKIVRTRHVSVPIGNNIASRWLYRSAVSHVVTTGESLRQQVITQSGAASDRVTSVPTGIDPDRFYPEDKRIAREKLGLKVGANYLGIVATLRSWKGHAYLLDAFAQAILPNWQLLIVGDGPMRNMIEAKIAELKLADRVHLVGQQNNPEDWLRAMDIFCLPSYANEGVPQALLQAMFTGLSIITTPVGAILEAVSNNETALIVEPKNSVAITAAIAKLASDVDFAAQLGKVARIKAVASFSRNTMLDRMEEIFLDVIPRH